MNDSFRSFVMPRLTISSLTVSAPVNAELAFRIILMSLSFIQTVSSLSLPFRLLLSFHFSPSHDSVSTVVRNTITTVYYRFIICSSVFYQFAVTRSAASTHNDLSIITNIINCRERAHEMNTDIA